MPWEESARSRFVSSAALRAAASAQLRATQAEEVAEIALKSLRPKIIALVQDAVQSAFASSLASVESRLTAVMKRATAPAAESAQQGASSRHPSLPQRIAHAGVQAQTAQNVPEARLTSAHQRPASPSAGTPSPGSGARSKRSRAPSASQSTSPQRRRKTPRA